MLFVTINDWPALSNLSGQTNKGYNACTHCFDDLDSIYLKRCRKVVYLGHRRFLPLNHQVRKKGKHFKGKPDLPQRNSSYPVPVVYIVIGKTETRSMVGIERQCLCRHPLEWSGHKEVVPPPRPALISRTRTSTGRSSRLERRQRPLPLVSSRLPPNSQRKDQQPPCSPGGALNINEPKGGPEERPASTHR